VRAKVGDRYVLEELSARAGCSAAKGSGHLLALDKHTTGDGIVSALQVLQAVRSRRGQAAPRATCSIGVTLRSRMLSNVKLRPGQDWKRAPEWPTCSPVLRNWATPAGADPAVGHRARLCADGRGA
jgi:phosphoglucosamine mutase